MNLPTVEIISLGGTIAMTGDRQSGVSPQLSVDDLVTAVPELGDSVNLQTRSFRQLPSAHLSEADLIELAFYVKTSLRRGTDGIVITQGTDTIEESAFLLDLLISEEKPVVVTGAMRPPEEPGADGPANLRSAVQTARSPTSRNLGVLVVLNDEIHAARFVRKINTFRPDAFASTVGPLGWVSEGRPQILLHPTQRSTLHSPLSQPEQRVALVTISLGDEGALLEHCQDYTGLVIETFGAGHVTASVKDLLAELATRMPVVATSRTGDGPLLNHTYQFSGSEKDLLKYGVISAGFLDGPKARLLLSLLLRTGADQHGIATSFRELGGGE